MYNNNNDVFDSMNCFMQQIIMGALSGAYYNITCDFFGVGNNLLFLNHDLTLSTAFLQVYQTFESFQHANC